MNALRVAVATVLMATLVTWTGCSREDSEPPAEPQAAQEGPPARTPDRQPGDSVLLAPADYLTTTVGALSHAKKTAAIASLTGEIQHFRIAHDRYPESLEELTNWRGISLPEIPKSHTYKYDPATGKVDVVPVQ